MLPVSFLTTTTIAIVFLLIFYFACSIYKKSFIKINIRDLVTQASIFCLFGLSGEIFVNNAYHLLVGSYLWEYKLYPIHHGDVSLFFVFIWGSLAFYKYIIELTFADNLLFKKIPPGLLMGLEAIFLEILYNGLFLLIFGTYIFYYLPANLGVFSHLSCLQVVPFYFLFGYVVTKLVSQDKKLSFSLSRLCFYWLVISALIF